MRLIAATPNGDTHDKLIREEGDALRLLRRVANKYQQAQHSVSTALQAGKVAVDNLIVSATDGFVRAFSGGKLVLQMDPDIPFGPMLKETSE